MGRERIKVPGEYDHNLLFFRVSGKMECRLAGGPSLPRGAFLFFMRVRARSQLIKAYEIHFTDFFKEKDQWNNRLIREKTVP